MYSLAEIIEWSKGKLFGDGFKLTTKATGVSIDTRTLKYGDIFFALKGEKNDGHEYLIKAFEKGALAAVVESSMNIGLPQIVVPDVLKAFQDCAREYRKKLNIKVVGVTGSNGKTTTKDMITAVLRTKYQVSCTEGNYNNHMGVPLSVLSAKPDSQFGVFEVGMNHQGETAPLAEIIAPQVTVITGIGMAHAEAFQDTKCVGGVCEAIAREKGDLVRALSKKGLLVIPEKEKFKDLISSFAPTAKVVGVSTANKEAVEIQSELIKGGFIYATAAHMIQNALLAMAVGAEFGVLKEDAIKAISKLEYEDGRFMEKTVQGIHIIDDTYNANPDSVCAAIDALGKINKKGKMVLVLGKLLEQGNSLFDGYQRIYENAFQIGIDTIVLCDIEWDPTKLPDVLINKHGGKVAPKIIHVGNHEECAEKIKDMYKEGDIVLFKGSKSSEMKKVIGML